MLSALAAQLLDQARIAEHPVDLYLAPGATRLRADQLSEVMRSAELPQLGERALWNLLFAAGELSRRVDVYRAHDLFLAATELVARVAKDAPGAGAPRGVALEMCFDFFFARGGHPLLPLRATEIIASLGRLLEGARPARRAAIHGLGHLIEHGDGLPWTTDAVALLDEVVSTAGDPELVRYAEEARTGELR